MGERGGRRRLESKEPWAKGPESLRPKCSGVAAGGEQEEPCPSAAEAESCRPLKAEDPLKDSIEVARAFSCRATSPAQAQHRALKRRSRSEGVRAQPLAPRRCLPHQRWSAPRPAAATD